MGSRWSRSRLRDTADNWVQHIKLPSVKKFCNYPLDSEDCALCCYLCPACLGFLASWTLGRGTSYCALSLNGLLLCAALNWICLLQLDLRRCSKYYFHFLYAVSSLCGLSCPSLFSPSHQLSFQTSPRRSKNCPHSIKRWSFLLLLCFLQSYSGLCIVSIALKMMMLSLMNKSSKKMTLACSTMSPWLKSSARMYVLTTHTFRQMKERRINPRRKVDISRHFLFHGRWLQESVIAKLF